MGATYTLPYPRAPMNKCVSVYVAPIWHPFTHSIHLAREYLLDRWGQYLGHISLQP